MGSADDGMSQRWASEPIAIIGMSSKFAEGATDNEGLWSMLTNKRSGWTPFPHSRFRSEGIYHPNNERLNSTHVKGAHFLKEDVGLFDAAFFGYSSETASSLDPQYRLQLESVYEALESAGLPLAQIAGSNTSVFTGVFVHDYRDGLLRDADNLPRLMATGTGVPMMSNRISHFFDLHGASMTIETACSSGMVALHQAIQSLRTHEADLSIVGGANLTLNPDMFKALGSSGFLSADGKCYAFDSRASGYGRGEGVATLLVKRLKDALANGDPIRAVIRESSLNQDGKTETITTPSREAQEALMRDCYRRAGLHPNDTQYFEAHGTGTQAGDTIEARAIATVFGEGESRRGDPLLIGSVKTNIGHTEAASGLASIIKTALAMERGVIPPSINFEKPNPKIPLEDWNLKLVRDLMSWPAASSRRASINNFGYGGTNAHIIMESTNSWKRDPTDRNGRVNGHTNGRLNGVSVNGTVTLESQESKQVLILSAKDQLACQRMVTNLKDFLLAQKGPGSTELADSRKFLESLAYTLGQRRSRFPWVAAYPVPVTKGIDAVVRALDSPAFKPNRTSRRPRIGMVFTGQGAQWHAMGRELVYAYPTYKASLETAERYLKELGANWSLLEELSRGADASHINDVELSTPICVAVQISLVRLLRAWGIVPDAVTSHSSGEIAAAYAAGAIGFREAMTISYYRAVLAAEKSLGRSRGSEEGAMVAVGLGVDETESYLRRLTQTGGKAVVACINSPSSTTVAGDVSAVQELEQLANSEGVFARRLRVNTAWHSHHMVPVAEAYVEAIDRTKTPAGKKHGGDDATAVNDDHRPVAFSSPVTGGRVSNLRTLAQSRHWVDSLVHPVRFVDAFTDMVLGHDEHTTSSSSSSIPSLNVDVIVEVGPHTALGGPIQEILALSEFQGLRTPYYGCLVRNTDAQDSMQALAASLLREGYPVDMDALDFANGRSQQDIQVLTTLPLYPWNHENRHWVEPRLNRALRARSEPPHDLLGSLVEGSNPDAASWRNILRISDVPWTRDHVIQSTIVFPAAGYVCLAIEAIRQISRMEDSGGDRPISGYRLREVDFMQALLIPNTSDGIEIQTLLRNASNRDIGARGWKHFEVWTVTAENRWTQHAKGLVSVETGNAQAGDAVEPALQGRVQRILPADLFANLRALGIAHGPLFQNMERIVQSGSGPGVSRSVVTLAIPDTSIPNDLPRDPILHPVTLDSIITAPYSTLPAAAARQSAPKVPRTVEKLWVSSSISHHPGHLLRAHSFLVRDDSKDMEVDVSVFDHESGNLVLEMGRFSYQSLGRNVASLQQTTDPWEKQLNSLLKWSPDISIGSSTTLASIRKQLAWKNAEDWPDYDQDTTRALTRMCVSFMKQALASLNPHDADLMEPQHTKYYTWMVDTVQQAASGQLSIGSAVLPSEKEPEDRRQLIDQVGGKARKVDVEMICRLGPHLAEILRGEVPSLTLMTQDGLLARFYDQMPTLKRTGSQLSGLLAHLVHKNPRARILEIGAGTGTLTRYALSALGTAESGGPSADLYHYTDVSATLFDMARESLALWSDLMVFDVLDPSCALAAQGFVDGTYDVVIASGSASANTNSVSRTLDTARSLLKPGGALLLTETVQDQVLVPFVQGLLFPESKADTILDSGAWEQHLRQAGFSGVSLELRDSADISQVRTSVTIMSTQPLTVPPEPYVGPDDILIITSKAAGHPPLSWLKGLQDMIDEHITGRVGNLPVVVQDLESATASSYANKFCIFVGEVNEPILYELNPVSLEGIRAICTTCKGLLWLTRGGAVDCERPEFSLASGFIRTLRTEHVARKFLTLDLDPASAPWSDSSVSAIVQVLRAALIDKAEAGSMVEPEYAEREGVMLIPRFYHDAERDRVLASRGSLEPGTTLEPAFKTSIELFHQQGRPLCLRPDALAFCDDEDGDTYRDSPFPPRFLEVEPRAYGVSPGPANKQNQISGLECAGIVTRVGSGVAAQGYEVGDEVVCVLRQKKQSSFSSRVTVEYSSTAHKPAGLSFQEAASLPLSFLTAYFSLVEFARLKSAQWVLVHAAAEPVGQAAIMIAQNFKAKVLATVGSAEQQAMITETYGIPAELIFDSSHLSSFSASILSATQGHGVDVVLNSLNGPPLQQSFNLVAPLGHFVEIGKRDAKANSNLEMRPFDRSVSFTSVDMDLIMEHRAADVHRCLREILRLVETRAVAHVHPLVPYPLGDVLEASRLLQQSAQGFIGKVVLSVDQNETVPVLQVPRLAKLAGDASYLIVGGNGGLGQLVAHWMVSRGARNLVLLSRNAAESEKTAALARGLQEAGCHRVLPVSCDVADEDDLARAIQNSAAGGLPPIRGVVHAAFALRDSFVNNMTFQDWKDTTQSKIAGAWNLHSHFNLPGDLDFFVLFSSINGLLGYASQAAYSAAGAYEDALAHWRVKQCGLPAVSIDLPVVDDVGYVAETAASEKLRRSLIKAGHRPIDADRVLASLESAIQAPYDPQFAVGISSGPGPHWELDGGLGRDPRALPLRYRAPREAAAQQKQQEVSREDGGDALAAKMTACASRDEAIGVVGEAMAELIAEMFLVPVEDVDMSESPSHQGIDSLMAVELRNMLFGQAGAEMSIFNIMQADSLVTLAAFVVDCSSHVKFAAES